MDIILKRGRDRDRDIFPPIKDPAVTRDRKVKYGDGRYGEILSQGDLMAEVEDLSSFCHLSFSSTDYLLE